MLSKFEIDILTLVVWTIVCISFYLNINQKKSAWMDWIDVIGWLVGAVIFLILVQ